MVSPVPNRPSPYAAHTHTQGEFIIAHPSREGQKTSVVFNGLSSPKQHYTNAELYALVFPRLLDDVQSGYNGCVFAYGQTGSGKTFTMLGQCWLGLWASKCCCNEAAMPIAP